MLALALATAGCSGGRSPSSAPGQAVGPGCGRGAASGSTTLVLTVAGHRRTVIVHVPTGYDATTPAALVLDMHGSGSTALEQEELSGMDATSDRHGFLVAYPQGLIPAGTGFDWNVPGQPLVGGGSPPPGAADDVAFLTDLVPALGDRYCIGAGEVYATGLSGGGRMASQLACDAAATFAAVAPVAGLRFPSPCPDTRAVPVVAFHGTADPVDPYNGDGQAYWTYSVPTAAQRWAAHDGCNAMPGTLAPSGYTLTTYRGCGGKTVVELYSLTGMGHEWPGGPRLPARFTNVLGPQSNAVDADAVMWAFFAAHRRS